MLNTLATTKRVEIEDWGCSDCSAVAAVAGPSEIRLYILLDLISNPWQSLPDGSMSNYTIAVHELSWAELRIKGRNAIAYDSLVDTSAGNWHLLILSRMLTYLQYTTIGLQHSPVAVFYIPICCWCALAHKAQSTRQLGLFVIAFWRNKWHGL